MPTYTHLRGITDIGQQTLAPNLEANLVTFLEYSFLQIGAFYNVYLSSSGVYGGNFSRLRMCDDPRFGSGYRWEAARHNWVWESGLEYTYQPIQISGVYINGVFHSRTEAGTYAHNYSYPLGQVVFQNAIPATSVVSLEYSFKYFNFVDSQQEWFRELQMDSMRLDKDFQHVGSGAWAILSQNRIQLPAIAIECLPNGTSKGSNIGGGKTLFRDVIFHIYSESPDDRNKMVDILSYQEEKRLKTFSLDKLNNASGFPITLEGYLASGTKTYPYLVDNYFWRNIIWGQTRGYSGETNPPFFSATVKVAFELDFPEI